MTGGLRKTIKLINQTRLRKLEKGRELITSNLNEAVTIINDMTMVQKSNISEFTFVRLAQQLFKTTLATESGSSKYLRNKRA